MSATEILRCLQSGLRSCSRINCFGPAYAAAAEGRMRASLARPMKRRTTLTAIDRRAIRALG